VKRVPLLAAGAVVAAVCAGLTPAGAVPIPPGPGDGSVPAFTGSAVSARPVDAPRPPQNPHLAANGNNSMHNDSYATDAYSRGGPRGKNLRVTSSTYGVEECATMAFDRSGRIVALCGGLEGSRLMLLDPDSLDILTVFPLPPRKPGTTSPLQDLCGGAYFYLDDHDRAVIETTNAQVWVVSEQTTPTGTPSFHLDRTYDVSPAVPDGDCLIALMPDWKGRIWFVTQQGGVGNVAPGTGVVRSVRLPGEKIVNSFATDETGGVFVASDHALYRFDAGTDGRPVKTWRQPYDRGSTTKPGQLSQGTGTTPTLIGKDLVVITDNADPRMNVVSYRRTKSHVSKRQVCKQAVFGAGKSDTENSPVAVGGSVVVENNYGYTSPQNAINGASSEPGLSRVDVTEKGCGVMWTSHESAPSSVAKASLSTGLLYAYTKPPGVTADPWYVTAIDLRSGRTAWKRLTGTGPQWNNHYASIYLGRGGTAYIATLAGVVRLQDSPG
jgi:hypothetical protein